VNTRYDSTKLEYAVILERVEENSSVLDLGCGTGDLLSLLVQERKVKAQGIEIDEQAIYRCVERGLSVFHGDIDTGLSEYRDKSFDYVILCQSFQQVKKPDMVLREALRVGKEIIVSFPNFAHFRARFQIFFNGKTPVTPSLPYEWHDTPNLHFLSISDFVGYCDRRNVRIIGSAFASGDSRVRMFPNFFAEVGVFFLRETERERERV
jgi:methionine biosynthesis protein MetW